MLALEISTLSLASKEQRLAFTTKGCQVRIRPRSTRTTSSLSSIVATLECLSFQKGRRSSVLEVATLTTCPEEAGRVTLMLVCSSLEETLSLVTL